MGDTMSYSSLIGIIYDHRGNVFRLAIRNSKCLAIFEYSLGFILSELDSSRGKPSPISNLKYTGRLSMDGKYIPLSKFPSCNTNGGENANTLTITARVMSKYKSVIGYELCNTFGDIKYVKPEELDNYSLTNNIYSLSIIDITKEQCNPQVLYNGYCHIEGNYEYKLGCYPRLEGDVVNLAPISDTYSPKNTWGVRIIDQSKYNPSEKIRRTLFGFRVSDMSYLFATSPLSTIKLNFDTDREVDMANMFMENKHVQLIDFYSCTPIISSKIIFNILQNNLTSNIKLIIRKKNFNDINKAISSKTGAGVILDKLYKIIEVDYKNIDSAVAKANMLNLQRVIFIVE